MDVAKLDTFEAQHDSMEEQMADLDLMLEAGMITPKQYSQMALRIAQAPGRATRHAARPVRE